MSFTLEEVARHNTAEDCWIVVSGKVYNMTPFLNDHPGGKKVLLKVAGKDATREFEGLHKPDILLQYGPKLYVGEISSAAAESKQPKKEGTSEIRAQRAMVKSAAETRIDRSPNFFGEGVPYGDPSWYQDWNSPYYKDTHRRWRAALRQFVDKEIMPFTHEWDEAKRLPADIWRKAYEARWLPGVAGPPWPTEYVGPEIAGGVKPEEFDGFHELILIDELARCGSGGVLWGIFGGLSIGLPPVIRFGSQYLKDKCVKACLMGEKNICLAITEPYAGSDVANIRCEAKKTPDGKHYIVNGEKKWITNGVFSHFFTVAVRTGGPGMGGISLLLIERDMPGVVTRQMQCMGVWSSGTTYISFEDVRVPVENLIGRENEGFKYIMYNFNHERWGLCAQAARFARVLLEESIKYAHKRKTFGQRLIDHAVIRNKIAHMARQVEATSAWLEHVTHQLNTMNHDEQAKLGGPIALLKAQSSITLEFCAREAAQIFGGLSYTRGGQGEKVERLYREVRAYAIPGGSEEIMLDLGVRQAIRNAKL